MAYGTKNSHWLTNADVRIGRVSPLPVNAAVNPLITD